MSNHLINDTEQALNYRGLWRHLQSTKVAVGRDGAIIFREGYDTKSESWWEQVFATLAQQ